MEQLNKTPTSGNFGNVAKVIDTNFGLVVTKLLELEQGSKDMNVGFYSSESELKVAYPNPEKGMMAYVGSGTDYIVYRCKTDGTWTKTTETFKVNISVDLSTYATTEQLNKVKASLDSVMLGATFIGIATPITNPGTPTSRVFYLPTEAGTYTNFSKLEVAVNEVAFLYWDGQSWQKYSLSLNDEITAISNKTDTASTNASNALTKATDAAKQATANKSEIDKHEKRITDVETTLNGITVPKLAHMTESAYDALESKDDDTYYFLTEE